MTLPYFWMGFDADNDGEVLMAYELQRLLAADLVDWLPDFAEIQHDE
jgi:hypothetical protein